MNRKGGTHLSKEDRKIIYESLVENKSCKEIAKLIDKDERTISKEIKKRRNRVSNGHYNSRPIPECKTLTRFPYVCNGCPKRAHCRQEYKYKYDPDLAQDNYKIILSSSREGIDMSLEDKIMFDTILKNGIDNGQSPYHIIKSNQEHIKCSLRTAYRMIDKQQTIVQNIDLRRKVKLKPRKHYKIKNVDNKVRIGRTYADFIKFYADNPSIGLVEIDTVEGKKEGKEKCLLTIHFTTTHFMLAFILEEKSKENVGKIFKQLQHLLGKELYSKLFKIILTDRGIEFVDVDKIEIYDNGEKVAHVFFCDSYSSYQKGAIEENHTLIRYIIPKGTSMNDYSQEKIELMLSHINSYERKSISTTPYVLMSNLYGKELLKKIRINCIDPNNVTLKPDLLK